MKNKENWSKLIDKDGVSYLNDMNPQLRLLISESEKRKGGQALAEAMIDYHDSLSTKTEEDYAYYDENAELHRGSWSTLEEHQDDISFKLNGKDQSLGGLKLRHFPIINTISMRILGEIVQRPLIAGVRDYSATSRNYRDRYRNKLTKEFLYQKLIKPKEDAIRQQFYQGLGIEDPRQLNSEQGQQVEQEIQKQLQNTIPDDLQETMELQQSPEEIIFQKFLTHIIKEQNIENKLIQGAENAITFAEEAYRLNVINGKPRVEVLNPKYVCWDGSEHVEKIQDGTFAKYEQYLTPQDIIQKYGSHLMTKDLKELESLFTDYGGSSGQNANEWKELEFTEALANNPELQDYIGQVNTREGQEKLNLIYAMVSGRRRNPNNRSGTWGIRESYVCWKWQRWMKLVTREVQGKRVELWKADHYKKDITKGDLKVERHLVPQVWHGVVLGEIGSSIKIKVEPVPWQYNSLKDPFDVKLPIFGRTYNTQMNNSKKVSFIDLGKPYQYEYNSLRRDWEKYRRTNLGKVILVTVNMLPDNMDFQDFYTMLDNLSFGLVNDKYEGQDPRYDMNAFRNFDLSKTSDMASVLKDMEYVKNEMYQAMYYNVSKLGQQGQYTTATTAQMNVQAADAQLAKFHNERRELKRDVLEYTLNLTLAAYADDEDMKAKVLDDMSIAYMSTNYEFLSTREYNIFVVDDYRETQRLEFVRQQMQAFIQNGANVKEVIALAKAESFAELEEIAEKVSRRQSKQVQQAQQAEIEALQQKTKQEMDMKKYVEEMKALRQERSDEVSLAMAELNAMQMANANDIDDNTVPDSLQRSMFEMKVKERMKDKELASKERIAMAKNSEF